MLHAATSRLEPSGDQAKVQRLRILWRQRSQRQLLVRSAWKKEKRGCGTTWRVLVFWPCLTNANETVIGNFELFAIRNNRQYIGHRIVTKTTVLYTLGYNVQRINFRRIFVIA
jgi:hypothetical protein